MTKGLTVGGWVALILLAGLASLVGALVLAALRVIV